MSSWKKNLPEWAIQYGKRKPCWLDDLGKRVYSVHNLEPSAFALGICAGVACFTILFGVWEGSGWKLWVTVFALFLSALIGFPWFMAITHDFEKSSYDQCLEMAAKLKARSKVYTEKEIQQVELHRGWLGELLAAQREEAKRCKIPLLGEFKIRQIDRGSRQEEFDFLCVFIEEASQYRFMMEEYPKLRESL